MRKEKNIKKKQINKYEKIAQPILYSLQVILY